MSDFGILNNKQNKTGDTSDRNWIGQEFQKIGKKPYVFSDLCCNNFQTKIVNYKIK